MGANNKDGKDQTSSTSFASILAGVQRMREEAGGVTEISTPSERSQATSSEQPSGLAPSMTPVQAPAVAPAEVTSSISPAIRTSHISHIQPNSINRNRTTLSEITGEPIAPRLPKDNEANHVNERNNLGNNPNHTSTTGSNQPQTRTSRPQTRGFVPSEILVNKSQTGNPLLKESMMKTTSWKFDSSILSDYYINPTLQILFLSLKYHKLRPEYIWQRLKKINKGSSVADSRNDRALRVLLTVVDIDSHQDILRDLLDFCIKHDLSLVLAWTFEEAGNYIVFAKQHDNAPAKTKQGIRGIRGTDYNSSLVEALTGIRLVNKTDVTNLLANCKSVKNIVQRSCQDKDSNLENIGGLGSTKLKNLKNVFLEPFIYNKEYKLNDELITDD